MGIILMRVSVRCGSWTSGVFQRLMAEAFPEINVLDVGRLLLNYVLSDPYVDVALVGVRGPRLRGTRFVELNNEISDDVASRIDGHEACLCEAHLGGAARSVREIGRNARDDHDRISGISLDTDRDLWYHRYIDDGLPHLTRSFLRVVHIQDTQPTPVRSNPAGRLSVVMHVCKFELSTSFGAFRVIRLWIEGRRARI
jgi:hypothetical protein